MKCVEDRLRESWRYEQVVSALELDERCNSKRIQFDRAWFASDLVAGHAEQGQERLNAICRDASFATAAELVFREADDDGRVEEEPDGAEGLCELDPVCDESAIS